MSESSEKDVGVVAILFLLALLLRLIYLFESFSNPSCFLPIVDAAGYDIMAREFVQHGTMNITFFWQQFFYPFFLSVVYYFSNCSILAVKVIQVFLGSFSCVMVYFIGVRLFGRRVGIISSLFMVFYGPMIAADSELVPAVWCVFWMSALLLLLLKSRENLKMSRLFVCGLLGGLGVVTRPNFLPILCLCYVFVLLGFKGAAKTKMSVIRGIVFIGVGFSIATVCVSVLNYRVTGHFGFLPASGGLNLYIGNNPDFTAASIRPGSGWQRIIDLPAHAGYARDMWERQPFFSGLALDYMRDQPVDFARGIARKALQFVSSREMPGNVDIYLFRRWSNLLGITMWKIGGFGFPFGLIFPLAMVGFFAKWRRLPVVFMVFMFLYPIPIIVGHVEWRYRLPMIVPLAILASAGVVYIIECFRKARVRKVFISSIILVISVLFSVMPSAFAEEDFNYLADLYRCSGWTSEMRGFYGNAFNCYAKSLELDPDLVDAHINIGVLLNSRGRVAEAIAHYNHALSVSEDLPKCHYNLGSVLLKEGRDEEAIEHYRRAVELKPGFFEAYMGLGRVLGDKGRFEEAIGYFEEAVKADGDAFEVHNQFGIVLSQAGRFDEALEHFAETLKLKGEDVGVYRNFGITYLRQGRFDDAIEIYGKLLGIDPENADALYNLGMIYARRGQIDDGIKYFLELCEIEPDSASVQFILARLFAQQGDVEKAIERLGITLELDPGNVQASEMLKGLEKK